MNSKLFQAAGVFVVFLFALYVEGYFYPGSLNWGFHFLGFLPISFFVLYIIVALAVIAYIILGNVERRLSFLAVMVEKQPIVFLFVTCILFGISVFVFRVRVPLLGDSFVMINNLENTFRGVHPLALYREPLAVYFFYYVANILQTYTYPALLNAFLVGEFFLGIGFITIVFFIIRQLVANPKDQLVSFLFLMAGSYMQLFLGYAEIYSVVLFFISLYVLVVILWVNQKVPFYIVPIIFLCLMFVHYLSLLLVPSILYLVYLEYKTKGLQNIIIGFGLVFVVIGLIVVILNFSLARFIPHVTHAPYLSLFESNDSFQAYTVFSPYHLVDLLNLGVLLCPTAPFLFAIAYTNRKSLLIDSVHGKVLFVTIIPVVLFFIIAKFDLGMATDWDITAPYLFLINLMGVFTFFNMKREYGFKILFLFFAITLLNSIVWFNINATVDPNINRKKVLGNSRMISREGYYLGTYHLTMYYYHNDDIPSMIQSWEQYIQHYPSDGRAYQKSIQLLIDGENLDADRIINLFERWLHAAPEDTKAKSEYANFCLDEGNRSMTLGKINDAERQFQRAIELNPSLVHAYNNLGVILGKIGQYDRAIEMYKKAIALDSNYIRAYENLGKAFAHEGVDTTAIEMFKKYIELNPTSPRGYENLAMMYYKMGDRAKSIDYLKTAQRLGSSLAQKFLAEKKIAR